MKKLANADQMKRIDGYSIEKIGIPSLVLMEKAALSVALEIKREIIGQKFSNNKILAVCGVGNNGGDGVAALRILKEWGYEGAVLLVGDENKASEQMQVQLSIARMLSIPVMNYRELADKHFEWSEYTVVIDAIFGIGLSKEVTGIFEEVITKINAVRSQNKEACKVVAVDIPSGIHASTGKVMGNAVKADITVTFGINKLGLVLYPGCEYAGEVKVEDIGFPQLAVEQADIDTFCYEKEDIKQLLPERKRDSNKGTYGKVLVIGGSENMAGACCFAAKAAYTIGAGLVKVMTEKVNRIIVQTILPEALLCTYEDSTIEEEKEMILKELEWATVIVLGPGLGKKQSAKYLVDWVLEYAKVPVIIDADGLNLIAEDGGFERVSQKENLILTPHLKEMERLTGDLISEIKQDIVSYAKTKMTDAKSILVLKDSRTIVCNGKRSYINISGNNGMAKGGSGDVLTGIIAGLLAQGMDCFEAAALSVYLHGLAGDCVVKECSQYSLLAGDLIWGLKKEIKENERVLSDLCRD